MDYSLYEQADAFKPVGAGILIAINAMQIFNKLGVKEEVESAGNIISNIKVTYPDLRVLSKTNLACFESKFGVKAVAIHRAMLQSILLKHLDKGSIHLGHRLASLKAHDGHVDLNFYGHHVINAPLVVGADGLKSTVRTSLFPICKIRSAGQICWRGIADYQLPASHAHELNEAWGMSKRFGFVQVGSGKVYWYAVMDAANTQDDLSLEGLADCYKGFHPLIRDIILASSSQNIFKDGLFDLVPLKKWSKGQAVLLGDAAHASTPNMGQGACQAIEDSMALAECLAKFSQERAFLEFEKLRKAKAEKVMKVSWSIGKLAHLRHPLAIKMRNILMSMMPAFMNKIQMESIFKVNHS